MSNIRQHILSELIASGLNFDNGFGFTDDESYNIVRNPLLECCNYTRASAFKIFKYAKIVVDELGLNPKRLYITMYGNTDSFVLTNNNHSYVKVTMCNNGEISLMIGDENYLRPNVRLRKTYTFRDSYKEFNNGGMKTITDYGKEEKVSAIIKRFNEGKFL